MKLIDAMIYLSVILGAILLPQIYGLLPWPVFYSILAGWIVYLLVAFAVAKGYRYAYHIALLLAILTLIVSLPQSAHYSLIYTGQILPAFTFIAGTVIQLALISMISYHFYKARRGRKA